MTVSFLVLASMGTPGFRPPSPSRQGGVADRPSAPCCLLPRIVNARRRANRNAKQRWRLHHATRRARRCLIPLTAVTSGGAAFHWQLTGTESGCRHHLSCRVSARDAGLHWIPGRDEGACPAFRRFQFGNLSHGQTRTRQARYRPPAARTCTRADSQSRSSSSMPSSRR